MADIIVLFAREDLDRARSVEAALASSGFAVEAQQFELQAGPLQAPAVVALWSRAMAASRAAISLAQSLLAEKRLVSARLDINVPASLFPGHAMHDLVRWGGDPDDLVLDGLIAEADRCVLGAKLAPKAAPAPAPVPKPPPPRAEPPPEPVRVQQVAGGGARPVPARAPANDLEPVAAMDPAAEEAKLWKAIRNSTSRADFEEYLARYGQDGLFAELALAKLETLPKPSPQRPASPQPGASLPVARFADSWRFGADWSTRAEPPRQREAAPAPRPVATAPAPAPAPAPAARAPLAPPGGELRRTASPPAPAPAPRPPAPQPAPVQTAAQPAPAPQPQHPPYLRIPANPQPAPAPAAPEPAAPLRPAASAPPAAFDRELADAPWDRVRVAPAPEPPLAPPPAAERLPPARRRRKKRGGAGGVLFLFLLLAAGAAGAYYVLLERPDLLQRVPAQPAIDWPLSDPAPEAPPPEAEPFAPLEPAAEAPPSLEPAPPAEVPAVPERGAAGPLPTPPRQQAQGRPAVTATGPDSLAAAAAALRPAPAQPAANAPAAAGLAGEPAAEPARPAFSYGRPLEAPAADSAATPAVPAAAAPAQQTATPRGKLSWARRPSPETIAGLYPREAERRRLEGRATLRCTVLVGGDLSCRTLAETPAGMGFGRAALQASRRYRAETRLSDGSSAVGSETQIDIVFRP